MARKPKLRFTVDSKLPEDVRTALPLSRIEALSHEAIELSKEAAQKSLDGALQSVLDLLTSLDLKRPNVRVSEVKFALAFDAGGEISILSLARGSISGTAGFEFAIQIAE